MLEYTKSVLSKFIFNENLFLKEFKKSLKWLENQERIELKKWIRINLKHELPNLQLEGLKNY